MATAAETVPQPAASSANAAPVEAKRPATLAAPSSAFMANDFIGSALLFSNISQSQYDRLSSDCRRMGHINSIREGLPPARFMRGKAGFGEALLRRNTNCTELVQT